MKEDFLHFVWKYKRFDVKNLVTSDDENIEIVDFGEHNHHAGPDFLNAKIKIGETLWAGNVEMHLFASEWYKHQHDKDEAYNNVILHVVFEEDKPVFRNDGEKLPCLVLKNRLSNQLLGQYYQLLQSKYWIPCQAHIKAVPAFSINTWLERLLVERLENKTERIAQRLEENKNHWEETFYQFIAKNFGLKVNEFPFELLAQSISQITLAKHKDNLMQIEALLFGQAGFLEDNFEEKYPNILKKEYNYLRKKYDLSPISKTNWKFLRLRPANFPTLRIAQFSTLIYQSTHLFSKILEAKDLKSVEKLFELRLNNYWNTHYVFDKVSKDHPKTLGETTIHLIIINTIVPFLFHYGAAKGQSEFQQKAFDMLEALAPEQNQLIEHWANLGIKAHTAYQTQALIQLKNEYCTPQKCLHCAIGNRILSV